MEVKIGTTCGNWKVISEKYKKDGIYWNDCECICGTIRPVRSWTINNSKTKGCGCSKVKTRTRSETVGDLSRSYFTSFKYSRTRKNIYFSEEITMEFLWDLFLKQDEKCAISGIPIFLNRQWSSQSNGRITPVIQTASIDRIDSSKGYFIDNLQWVHKDINMMKGSMAQNDFIAFCIQVANNNKNLDYSCNFDKKLKWYGSTNN